MKEETTMKKLTTLTGWLVMTAALTIGFSACSNSEDAIEQPQQPATGKYTMTIKASKGNNATTRALTLSDKMLTATWATSEHVYVKKGSTWANGSLVPDADAATANLSGELSGVTIAATDELTLQFPKSGDFSYAGQKGTLSDIAQNFDYATADVTVASVTNGNINVSGTTTFTNHQAIVKFIFVDKADGTTKLSPTALTVSDGTSNISTLTDIPDGTYSDPNNGAGVLFVAIPGFSGKTITLTATIGGTVYTYTRPSTSFTNGQYYEITVKMEKAYVNLSALTSNYTAQDGDVLKGSLNSIVKIEVAAGATVTLDGATINGVYSDNTYYWSGINCLGDATIILSGENTVKGFHCNCPGIYVPYGNKLIIQGSGSLNASSNGYGAGIGGGYNVSCGDIKIEGGNITATGGAYCAGIGGGTSGSTGRCGSIEITGGTINATGGEGAAGIGAGSNSICGNISISGGTITATGGLYAAGIGGSAGKSSTIGACGDISITGGTIDATGGNSSAGIGGGFWCGDITITSGVIRVTSTKGSSAPYSIGGGGGSGTHCGTVTIGSNVGAISESPYTYPEQYPEGAIRGKFSVSATKTVYFSKGNLQYQASTNTWRFSENQYDYIGNAAGNTAPSSSQEAWIDLFNWGTSGYNHGANCYQPWSTNTNYGDYYAYGSSTKNLYDDSGKADWGYNAISNGGNTENSGWRTLTKDEWAYLINTRSGGYRYAKGTIHSNNGFIIFPDGFTLPDGISISDPNTAVAGYTSYSDADWTTLEACGCVFLPATGMRHGTTVSEYGSVGNYWSSTYRDGNTVYNIRFDGSSLKLENDGDRRNGFPVRLVK